MSTLDEETLSMALDDYYEQCVVPKPHIPKPYGFHLAAKNRQAARLRSYRDNPAADDDGEDEEDDFDLSITDSSAKEFEKLHLDDTEPMDQSETKPVVEKQLLPANSAQWRIKLPNVNRPQGAPPLVPNDAPRKAATNQNVNTYKKRYYNKNNNNNRVNKNYNKNNNYNNNNKNNFNNNNKNANNNNNKNITNKNNNFNNNNNSNIQNSVHSRLGNNPGRYPQRMTNVATATNNNGNNNNNIPLQQQQQQQVLMNLGQFQASRPQLILTNQANQPIIAGANLNGLNIQQLQAYQNLSSSNWQSGSDALTSLVQTANRIRTADNPVILAANNAQILRPTLNACSNTPYNVVLAQPANLANAQAVASDSVRLADLMNMDKSICVNLNVAEVAKSAMMLLSSVFHKPILDDGVQQELLQLQNNNGVPAEPHGLNLNIRPETTDLRMYHRFK